MKFHLVDAEFNTGEFGQRFCLAVKVEEGEDLDDIIENYFIHYYEDEDLCEHEPDTHDYLYHCGTVAVKVQSIQEISEEEYNVFDKYTMTI